jgi:hypothetical protein
MVQKIVRILTVSWLKRCINFFSQYVAQTVAAYSSDDCKATLVLLGEKGVVVCEAERNMQSQTD